MIEEDQPNQAHLTGAQLIERRDDRTRQSDDDARVDDERHAVADAALGDLLAEPHDQRRARRQREHRHQPEAPARAVDQRQPAGNLRRALEPDGNTHRLDDAQQDRSVARVLRDLAPAELAFLRDALEVRPHHRQQLQDDRRADVRHDAEREDRHPRQVVAGEHVVEPEHRAARLLDQLRERRVLMPGVGMWPPMRYTTSIAEREQHALPKLGDGEQVFDAIDSHIDFLLLTFYFPLRTFTVSECLGRAAGSRNLLRGLAAEFVRAHGQPLRNLAAAQHLHELG